MRRVEKATVQHRECAESLKGLPRLPKLPKLKIGTGQTSAAEAGGLISFTAGLKTCSTPLWHTVKPKLWDTVKPKEI
jgi:hypothetical protein